MEDSLNDLRLQSILLDSDTIQKRVAQLAAEIAADYAGSGNLCVIGVLKGAAVFTVDLLRELSRAGMHGLQLEFIRASTYQSGMKSAGETAREVKITSMTCHEVAGRNVLLVDDILDQGFTMSALKRHFLEKLGARSVKCCVFLTKQLEHPTPEVLKLRQCFTVEYRGFEVADRWVVGYGLDVGEEFRDLPYVAIAREECFR